MWKSCTSRQEEQDFHLDGFFIVIEMSSVCQFSYSFQFYFLVPVSRHEKPRSELLQLGQEVWHAVTRKQGRTCCLQHVAGVLPLTWHLLLQVLRLLQGYIETSNSDPLLCIWRMTFDIRTPTVRNVLGWWSEIKRSNESRVEKVRLKLQTVLMCLVQKLWLIHTTD